MDIGTRIKEQRTKIGITQQELADKIDLSLEMVRSMENNRKKPSIETLTKLSDLFDCSTDYLLGKINRDNSVLIRILSLIRDEYDSSDNNDVDEFITALEKNAVPDDEAEEFIKQLKLILKKYE